MTSASSSEVAAGMHVSSSTSELRQIEGKLVWELPATGGMRVPARVFADRELLAAIAGEASLAQLVNVAALPGVFEAVLRDARRPPGLRLSRRRRGGHGVARRRRLPRRSGLRHQLWRVRLLALPLQRKRVGDRREALVHEISRAVPAGAGKESRTFTKEVDLDRLLLEGSQALGSDDDVTQNRVRLSARSRSECGLATCQGTRSRPDRHDGIEQPLRRGAGGG